MRNARQKICAKTVQPAPGLILAVLFLFGFQSKGQTLRSMDEVKVWHFAVQHGGIDIMLTSRANDGHPLETIVSFTGSGPVGTDTSTTPSEEADLLRKVVQEMSSLGYDPKNLVWIDMELAEEPELHKEANLAVTRSGKWKSCVRTYSCWAVKPIIDQYLKSVDAFKEFDDVLNSNGLKRTSVVVDEPKCSKSRVSGGASGTERAAQTKVSCDGLIFIYVGRAAN